MRVVILGAGVVGVTSAYFLAKKGYEVTVIEACDKPAQKTSYSSGCHLSYCYTENFASFSNLKQVPFLLTEKHPALFINPLKLNITWTAKFLFQCFRSQKNIETILKLLVQSKKEMYDLLADVNIEFSHINTGKLDFYRDEKDFITTQKNLEKITHYYPQEEFLTPEECIEKEPALEAIKDDIVGGVYSGFDESGDASQFAKNLAEILEKPPFSVKFLYNTRAEKVITEGNRIKYIQTTNGDIKADNFVASMGAYTPFILYEIGVKPSIYPLKGYSLTVPIKEGDRVPSTALKDHNNKIVYANLGDKIRIAGKVGLVGYDENIDEKHIRDIETLAKKTFPDWNYEKAEKTIGLRPATPSGVPYIEKTKYDNLFLNTGHGMLGWTLAPVSGKMIADII